MFVNENIIKELYNEAGETRVEKARIYYMSNKSEVEKIQYDDENNFEITGKVLGNKIYKTYIRVQNGEIDDVICECSDYYNRYAACKHIVATMMEFIDNPKYQNNNMYNNVFVCA